MYNGSILFLWLPKASNWSSFAGFRISFIESIELVFAEPVFHVVIVVVCVGQADGGHEVVDHHGSSQLDDRFRKE